MNPDETPINGQPRAQRLREAAEEVSLAVEEHVIWRGEDAARSAGKAARSAADRSRWPFEQALWSLRRRALWPLQDRFALLEPRTQIAGTAVAAVLVAAALTGGVLAASSGDSSDPASTPTVAATTPPPATVVTPAPEPQPEPHETLHGAAPVFEPAGKQQDGPGGVDAATATPSSPASSAAGSDSSAAQSSAPAATDSISSVPDSPAASAEAAAARAGTAPEAVEGKPAGPAAIAVARRFSEAFVLYETGGDEAEVKEGFAASASPELAESLLERPPRLPQNVKVPKAKVVNVVAGPSRGGVYSVSVSLLRVGVTSELRLSMEKLKKDGWQVTNVLG